MVDRGNVSFRFIVWGLWICAVNVINLITISFWVVLFFMKTKFLLFLFGQWCICKAAGVRRPERQLCQTGGSQHALPPPTSQDLLPSPFLWYVHTPVSRLTHLSRSMRSSKSHQIAGKPCSLQERWRIIWIRLFFWVLLTFFFVSCWISCGADWLLRLHVQQVYPGSPCLSAGQNCEWTNETPPFIFYK